MGSVVNSRTHVAVNTVAVTLVTVSLLSALAHTTGRRSGTDRWPPQRPAPSAAATPEGPLLTVVVLDAQGRPVPTLRAADFDVTVDGFTRDVVRAAYVFRGPGAEVSARRALAATTDPVLAEPARAMVVAVDETTIPRGGERAAATAVRAILDRLGPSDRVAVVRLPQFDKALVVTSDRARALEVLRHLTGRASPDQRGLRERPLSVADGEGPLPARYSAPADEAESADPLAALGALPGLLERMRETPGPKTLVVVSAGQPAASRAARDEPRRTDAAAAAQTVVHLLLLPGRGARSSAGPLERLAAESGGSVFALDRAPERQFDQLMAEIGGFYALTLDKRAKGDAALCDVRVATRRPDVRTIVARRWTPQGVSPGIVEVRPVAPAAPPPALPDAHVNGAQAAPPRDPELDLVLARTVEYVQAYVRDFTSVVAEEEYDQRVDYPSIGVSSSPNTVHRVLRSDFLTVSTPDLSRWLPFRDVFEADGKKIRDREDRLRKLFIDAPKSAAGDARRITDESARYNLGSIDRTINVPTLALEYLFPAALARLRVERRGEESIDGVRAWRIDFDERSGPTLIRTPGGGNLPASGSFWIDPVTGRIVKTILRTDDRNLKMAITVLYRGSDELGLWVPSEMRERYEREGETLTAVARYSNFRRFQVSTSEDIKKPPA
jgi:hypothetical protein